METHELEQLEAQGAGGAGADQPRSTRTTGSSMRQPGQRATAFAEAAGPSANSATG